MNNINKKSYKTKIEESRNPNSLIDAYFRNWRMGEYSQMSVMKAAQTLIDEHEEIENYAVSLSRKHGNAGDPVKALSNEILKRQNRFGENKSMERKKYKSRFKEAQENYSDESRESWSSDDKNIEIIDDEEYLVEPDWKDIKKGINSWNVFEDVRDLMSVEEFIEGLEDNFNNLYESNLDYISETADRGVQVLLEDKGYDYEEVQEEFSDGNDELRFAVEDAMNWNVESIVPDDIFIKDDDEYEVSDMRDIEESSDEFEEMVKEAKKYGFSQKDVEDVWNNSSYSGMAGVGIIVEGKNLVDFASGLIKKLEGNSILYCHDNLNGSGYYILGKKFKELKMKLKDIINNIDYGNYSLGDVFGTSDWAW